jgi:hypothetical protein
VRRLNCEIPLACPSTTDTSSFRCYVFTFDSLGGGHSAVTRYLRDYLVKEAKDKLNIEHTSPEKVKGREAKVGVSPLKSLLR